MKKLIIAILLVSGLTGVISQNATAQKDSTSSTKVKALDVSLGGFTFKSAQRSKQDSLKNVEANKGRFIGGITFTRLDLGFSKLIDNGSFNLSPENEFLSYKGIKTSTISFDVLQFGYRFNPQFKVYLAGGFDWTLIRLRKNITIQQGTRDLAFVEETTNFSKNRFSNSYVHIPLNFELRSKENDNGKRFYFVFGPEVSFLLNGKVKQVSDEHGKVKYKDDYNFQSFRYGGTVRLGYGGIGLFTKYYFNDMFDSPAQKGLKNMSVGITFGMN
ncbi:hypothetical protein AAKU52_001656 [Pedobacter sp. CG_S7]|uniref:outer membrane beta-barrel protein n=1 Tax=Pedobacter sp. CG_S7 TaxID=3143930 RepID=UPI0033989960